MATPDKIFWADASKRSAGVLAAVLLGGALLPVAARAQALPTAPRDPSQPSAEALRLMRQELDALKAQQAQTQARIDALAQQLGAAPGGSSSAPPPTELATAKPSATSAGATKVAAGAGAAEGSPVEELTVRVFGRATLDAYYNSARAQAPGNPVFLVPKFAGGFSQQTTDLNARNSMVGVAFTGPMIGDFQTGGRITAVFFDNTNLFADRNGFLLTQSYGELFNDRWRFAAGLQLDVVAPLVPTVLPFAIDGAPIGNNIKGQIRAERFVRFDADSQLTLQVALSEPLTTAKTPDISLDEDNGKPNLEGRAALGLGKPAPVGFGLLTQRPFEIALSGMVGQLRRTSLPSDPPRRVVSDVWLAAVDFQVNLARLLGSKGDFGFKGEAYTGAGLGNYGGGILQSLDAITWKAIRTSGGWAEGYIYLTPHVHSHTGFFIDDPNDNDITAIPNSLFGRTYNGAVFSTLIWDVNRRFRTALEATYRKTEYKEPTNLPNEGLGLQTQIQWTF